MMETIFASNVSVHDHQITMKGIVGATSTIFLTTLEDAIWLVPFCFYASTSTIRIIHSFLFVGTFTALSTSICLITIGLRYYSTYTIMSKTSSSSSSSNHMTETISFYSSIIGAMFCWLLAFYFYWKSLMKRKRKQKLQEQQRQLQQEEQQQVETERRPLLSSSSLLSPTPVDGTFHDTIETTTISMENGQSPMTISTEKTQPANAERDANIDENDHGNQIITIHAWTVITLTMIGALDEVSYFPSLLLGNILTSYEIIIGTFLASLLELSVVFFFLSSCQPILHVLDQIPIYYVIFFFAIVLSCEVLWDYLVTSIH
jgi:cadmium resistance protein CadD (predicted permease)